MHCYIRFFNFFKIKLFIFYDQIIACKIVVIAYHGNHEVYGYKLGEACLTIHLTLVKSVCLVKICVSILLTYVLDMVFGPVKQIM